MSIRSYSHVAIGIADMERSLAFYRDVLGLQVMHDAAEDFPQMGNIAPHRRRGVYLRWETGREHSHLVLDEQPRTGSPIPRELSDYGVHHFGFWVGDIAPIYERALQAGSTIMMPPCDNDTSFYGERAGGLIRSALFRDPDGNIVQLDQRLSLPEDG